MLKYFIDGKTEEELMEMEKSGWRKYLLTRVRRLEVFVGAGILANFLDLKLEVLLELLGL